MRWLLDEMLPPATCQLLVRLGHDAISVHDAGLSGMPDDAVFDFAVRERRLVVTENFADYAIAVDQRINRSEPCVPVIFVRKSGLPRRAALAVRLAQRLDDWARSNPDPYLGPHWA
jgi:hypothetical protein